MRPLLALGLLMTLCTSASAATVHHAQHHVLIRHSHGWTDAVARAPIHYDDTPNYDDPSKFGGGLALPIKR